MKRERLLAYLPVITIGLLGAVFFLNPFEKVAYATVTVTITGWLVPDPAHLGYGLMPILMGLGGVAGLTMIPLMFRARGDIVVWLALVGMLLGSIGSNLTVGGGSSSQYVPFAMIVTSGVLLFLWWWNSD